MDLSNNTSLEYLNLSANQVSALDLGKNQLLEYLDLSKNQISVLDLSDNPQLHTVYITENDFSGDELNKTFRSLHENLFKKSIGVRFNPGSDDCDLNIAIQKGWHAWR